VGPGGNSVVRTPQKNVIAGYHAPAPGSHTGVADYAETLRLALAQFCDLRPNAAQADIHLYHLGNNKLHADIYRRALETPGVIVLHDAVLQHFLLGTLTEEQYIAEWVYNYGEWRRPVGEELWRERAKASVDHRYFEFPMLRRILEASRAVIVHNPGAAGIARKHGAATVETIPHFCEEPGLPSSADVAQFRERTGIAQGARLFGMFGYLREPKRVLPCMRAFERLHAVKPDTALLIAGEVVSGDLARLLKSETHPAIYQLGHLSDSELRIAGAAIDCCLNLRYPGAGETSGIAVRMMGLGKPVIVTRNAENSDFPDDAVLRVSPGIAEAEELFEHMILVTQFPAMAREVGAEARRHIRKHHALASVAHRYWEVLCSAVSQPS
jgi:glycosyltransferase involved in cell wall biosynthesis